MSWFSCNITFYASLDHFSGRHRDYEDKLGQSGDRILSSNITKPIFPSWVDEIDKSRPDMNIKVAAFTVTVKSYNTEVLWRKMIQLLSNKNTPYFDILPMSKVDQS